MQRRHASRLAAALLVIGVAFLGSCSDDEAPIRLGVIAGISGGNADLGQAGRNGFMLAVEEVNRAGGINGRPIELVIRDDGNSRDAATAAAKDLVKKQVAAIVGPFTSSMAAAVRSVTEPNGMLVFSPTASSVQFYGRDDHFFRLCSTSTDNAEYYAEFLAERRRHKRVSMAVDQTNPVFSKSFVSAFSKKFQSLGGEIVVEAWTDFRALVGYDDLVDSLREPKPDAVFLVANAVDAARTIQQFRKEDSTTEIVVVEWAGTQQLIELGGKAVEGVEILQVFNKFGTEERYVRFVAAFMSRFDADPSFSSVIAYEVIQVLRKAMEKQKDGQSLKEAILANRPYQGLQQTLTIDQYGDTVRNSHFVVVQGTEFVPAP